MNKKRIFIACADERLRIALVIFLEGEPGLTVVGFTDRLESLLPQLEASQAEILLLEWQLAYPVLKDTLDNVHKLRLTHKIIYFSGTPEDRQQILAAGADYVILKNAPPDELLPILKKIDLQSTNA
jgi:DNA-binding NarL/FixJ family response regulator